MRVCLCVCGGKRQKGRVGGDGERGGSQKKEVGGKREGMCGKRGRGENGGKVGGRQQGMVYVCALVCMWGGRLVCVYGMCAARGRQGGEGGRGGRAKNSM